MHDGTCPTPRRGSAGGPSSFITLAYRMRGGVVLRRLRGQRWLSRWLAFSVIAAAVGAGTYAVVSARRTARAGDLESAPTHTVEACAARSRRARFTSYSLRSSFAGLPLADSSELCDPPEPGQPATIHFSSRIYGDCQASPEYGCEPPLEIQSWPQCERNLRSYRVDSRGASGRATTRYPHAMLKLREAPALPAASFDGGTRIEMYTGKTTVVVFAAKPHLGLEAARALAQRMRSRLRGASRHALVAAAQGSNERCGRG